MQPDWKGRSGLTSKNVHPHDNEGADDDGDNGDDGDDDDDGDDPRSLIGKAGRV